MKTNIQETKKQKQNFQKNVIFSNNNRYIKTGY